MINQLDIYSQVVLVIPSVVWGELEQQIIEKHDELIDVYKRQARGRPCVRSLC